MTNWITVKLFEAPDFGCVVAIKEEENNPGKGLVFTYPYYQGEVEWDNGSAAETSADHFPAAPTVGGASLPAGVGVALKTPDSFLGSGFLYLETKALGHLDHGRDMHAYTLTDCKSLTPRNNQFIIIQKVVQHGLDGFRGLAEDSFGGFHTPFYANPQGRSTIFL